MKKIIAVLFAILIIATSVSFAEDTDSKNDIDFYSMTVLNNEIYAIADNAIYKYDTSNGSYNKIMEKEIGYARLFTFDNNLYAVDINQIYKIELENKSVSLFKTLEIKDLDNANLRAVISTKDDVALLYNNYSRDISSIYWLNAGTTVEISSSMFMSCSASADGTVVIANYNGKFYKADKNKVQDLFEIQKGDPLQYQDLRLVYNKLNGNNYIICRHTLYSVNDNWNLDTMQAIGFLPLMPSNESNVEFLSNNRIAYLFRNDYTSSGSTQIQVCSYDSNTYNDRLIKTFGINEYLVNRYNAQNRKFLIDDQTNISYMDRLDTSKIANHMKSSDAADVYMLRNVESRAALAKNDYLADLGSSEILKNNAERYYSYVKNVAFVNDKLMYVPIDISNYSFRTFIFEDQFKDLGFTQADVPHTYSEFIDFLLEAHKRLENSDIKILADANVLPIKDFLMLQIIDDYYQISQRESKPVDFKNPSLRALINKLEQADLYLFPTQKDIIENNANNNVYQENVRYLLGSRGITLKQNPNTIPIELAIDEEHTPIKAMTINGVVVNNLSGNKERAIEFVEDLINFIEKEAEIYMYKDIDDDVVDPSNIKWIEQQEKEIKELEKNIKNADEKEKKSMQEDLETLKKYYIDSLKEKYLVRKEDLDNYKANIDQYYAKTSMIFDYSNKKQMELVEKLMLKQMSIDNFLNELERIKKMSDLENR